ncbi:hypothetical protein Leryth_007596 [Lithospermum erythrorhizon]|nr:hypothetical protein Leryth_007596 [Lithospermum erythrorhizon]
MEVVRFPCSTQSLILRPKAAINNPRHHLLLKSLTVDSSRSKSFTISASANDNTPPPLREVSPSSMQCEQGFLIPNKTSVVDDDEGGMNAMEYLTNIRASMVYDVVNESPLQLATRLSQRLGVNMWLKREDLQPVFSRSLSYDGWGLGEQLDKGLGGTVVLVGDAYDEAQAYAKSRGAEEGRTFIPPFDHPDIIIGHGTVGMEIVQQMKDPIHAIFIPVGGGGLIAGIAAYIKSVAPEIKIIGVEPSDANAMALSLYHGQRITLDQVGGFTNELAVKVVGAENFRLCKELIDGIVLVNLEAIRASTKDVFEEKRSILEPAGSLALAGAEAYCKYYGLKDVNVVAITSSANMYFRRQTEITKTIHA